MNNQNLLPQYSRFQSMNQFGSYAENGMNSPNCPDYTDRPFDLVYQLPTFNSGTFTNQAISISTDADFVWRAISIQRDPDAAFDIRFYDATGYYLSDDYLPSVLFANGLAVPWVLFPEKLIPAGGKIGYDIVTPGGLDDVQIILRGCKRFRLRKTA